MIAKEEGWRRELHLVLDMLDQAIPGAVRAVYLHGSRADGTALPDSDIDLTVVVSGPDAMVQGARALGRRRLSDGQRFDVHVDTLELLGDPRYAFVAARLKYSGELIRGDDVRTQVPEPDFAHFRSAVATQACKGIAMLRDAENVSPPVDYPNVDAPFFGYTRVRKRDWYDSETLEGTKELVAVATFCASAWVVAHSREWVTSKAQALRAIRRVEGGTRADLVEDLYRLCRVRHGSSVPTASADCSELTGLCARFLTLENETLTLTKTDDGRSRSS